MTRLNALPDTVAGVQYTTITSPGDMMVTPRDSAQLQAVEGPDVVNVDLGAVCGVAPRHQDMPHDPAVNGPILWGLTREAGE